MGALLGKGIFTSDGALWEHSRVGKSVFWRRTACLSLTGSCPSQLYKGSSR
jgi:hypothetical protein